MSIQPTDLAAKRIQGSDTGLLATWTFWSHAQADHFEVQWQYYNGTQRGWVTESAKSVPMTSWVPKVAKNGHAYRLFQDTYNAPTGVDYESIRVRVRAIAATHKVAVGKNKDGSAKYETKPYWDPTPWTVSQTVTTSWQMAAPDPPTRVKAEPSGSYAKLTWEVSDSRVTYVAVWRSVDGGALAKIASLVAKSSGSYLDKSATKGHVYRYRLKSYASRSKLYSELSDVAAVEGVPLAPNKLEAKIYREDGAYLEWEKQAYSGSSYVVSYSTDPGAFGNYSDSVKTVETTHQHIAITGLERGKTWYFRVQAKSAGGLSAYSQPKSVALTPDPKDVVKTPTVPTLVALYWSSGIGAMRVVSTAEDMGDDEHWEMELSTVFLFTSDTTQSVTIEGNGYAVRRQTSSGEYSYGTSGTGYESVGKGVVYAMTQAEPGKTYYARARRANSKKRSQWSNVLNCTIPDDGADLKTPTVLALVPDGAWLRAAVSVPTSRATAVEMQVSTVSEEFSDTGVQTVTYDNGWRTIYSDGETWRGSSFAGATARGTGVVLTLTQPQAGKRHWVRARIAVGDRTGPWSGAASAVASTDGTIPDPTERPQAPSALSASVQEGEGNEGNVTLRFADPYDPAEKARFEIQWTPNARAFSDNAMGDIKTATWEPETSGSARSVDRTYTVTSLDRGQAWYFRLRKVNAVGPSAWADAASGESFAAELVAQCFVPSEAEALSAPTTVAGEANAEIGSTVVLSWAHSSEQGSDQTAWQVGVTAVSADGDVHDEVTVEGTGADSSYALSLADGDVVPVADGTVVRWRVRTQGVAEGVWSPWSGQRSVTAWSAPTAGVSLTDGALNEVGEGEPLTMLPLCVTLQAMGGAAGNDVVAWWAEVVSGESYDGDGASVSEGEVLWSGQVRSGQDGFSAVGWRVELAASDLSLESGVTYVVRGGCTSAMGLRSEVAETSFVAQWATGAPVPSLSVAFDDEAYEAHVWPRCAPPVGSVSEDDEDGEGADEWWTSVDRDVYELPATFYVGATNVSQGQMSVRVEEIDLADDMWSLDPNAGTVTINEDERLWPPFVAHVWWWGSSRDSSGAELLAGATLSVWRVEQGGAVTLVADDLPNDGLQEVIDPHASFGTCTYRVVATDPTTGATASSDASAASEVTSIVISWDGDMRRVELPYNVRTSESRAPDVSLVTYAGRANPVAYRGTQRGETGSWSSDLIRDVDADRLDLLREAVAHDCYVREPSGVGYWASVGLRVEHSYQSEGVTVSLDVTRIETPAGEVA